MKKDIQKSFSLIFKWAFISLSTIIIILFFIFIFNRFFHYRKEERIKKQVGLIHSAKISLADVMGNSLPLYPENPNATIVGVDVNLNGVRDDVELAIFQKYPESAKIRAGLLQYAQVQQMILSQPLVNEEVATEIAKEDSRADKCLADIVAPRENPESFRSYTDLIKIEEYISFVEDLQFNISERKKAKEDFYDLVRSFSDLEQKGNCDINIFSLPN